MSIIWRPTARETAVPRPLIRGMAALLALLLATPGLFGFDWPNLDSLLVPEGWANTWFAVALVLLAHGLARGAREAWTLLSLVCFADLTLAAGAHAPLLAIASLALALAFLLGRGQFTVRCPTLARRLGYMAVAAALAGAWTLPVVPALGPWAALPLQAVFALTGVGGLLMLLRPAAPRPDALARAKLSRVLSLPAAISKLESSLALEPAPNQKLPNSIWSYALEPDKSHFVSARWPGGVAYRVRAGVALAVGEPIGPEAARVEVAAEFSAYCRAHGWLPAFYQVSNSGIDAYRAVGLRPLKIGEEAMIDVPSFTLAGKRIANVRHCLSHVERHGLRADMYMHGVAEEDILAGVSAVSAAWLSAEPGRGEMGYSMGSFSHAVMSRACTAVARDPEGVVVAFITFRQAGHGQGMVLDLMRRGPAAPPGTIDFLIARALERFRAEGVPFASLSLAPLANVREDGCAPRIGRLLALVYEHGNGLYRYKSLYNFKKKFAPRWEPRYLLYPARPWALPRVALAVALVHMPKGALRLPNPARLAAWLGKRLRRMLDWQDGLRPGSLGHTLMLMTVFTLAASVPELWRAITLFGRHSISPSYAGLSLALAAGNVLGAVALARCWDIGRRLLTLGALGFFVQAIWGLAEGYVSGWLGWSVDLALAPIEAWMIWFLLQPEVRAHLRNRRRGAALRERTTGVVRMRGS